MSLQSSLKRLGYSAAKREVVKARPVMVDDDLEKKLDEGLALLHTLVPPVRRVAVVLDGGGVQLLRPDEIVYFTPSGEADRRLWVYTADGKQYFNFSGLSDMQTLLAADVRFQRVHKSFLVNLEHVTSIAPLPDGRALHFAELPALAIPVPTDNLKILVSYFGVQI